MNRRVLFALAVSMLVPAWCAADPPADLARGDQLYDHGRLVDSRAVYAAALAASPRSFTVLCRLTRVESEMGEDATGEDQRRLIAAAVEHARAAVKLAPDSAEGHVWLAVALGRQALKAGPRTKLGLAREIKSEVDRGIAIDPNIGRAYHVRALWNRNVASLNFAERAIARSILGGIPPGASMENAVRDLRKAIELDPRYVNHRLELGRTYRMMGDIAGARRELEQAIALPPTSGPRDAKYQAEARELLSKLPKRS